MIISVLLAAALYGIVNLYAVLPVYVNQYYNYRRVWLINKQKWQTFTINQDVVLAFSISTLSLILLIFSPLVSALVFFLFMTARQACKHRKMSFTRRNITLLVTSIIIEVGCVFLVYFHFSLLTLSGLLLLFILPSTILGLANLLLFPLESEIRHIYVVMAQKKLRKNAKLRIIGITGSYGKTSLKNYLATLLGEKYTVLKTPGSVNTKMGICKFINESLSPYDEYLIIEYGVDQVGGMDKLLKLVRPDMSVITAVGPMHLTTFKTLENIKKEKLKLAYAAKEKIVFYNSDCPLLLPKDFYGYFYLPYSLGEVDEITIDYEGTHFVYNQNDYHVKLYGRLHLLNLLGAIKIARHEDVSLADIKRGMQKIMPVPHRLSLEKHGSLYVLDDAYNGNREGIIEGIHVLKSFNGRKGIITPGVIEAGSSYEQINFDLGTQLMDIDEIYIVGDETHPMARGYLSKGGSNEKLHYMTSFIKSYERLKHDEIDIVLIANDALKIHLK